MDEQPPTTPDPAAWVRTLAVALRGAGADVAPSHQAVGSVLRLAREVAHGTERLNAPLCAYVAGRYVAARMAGGSDEQTALAEVSQTVSRLLSEHQ